MLAGAALVLAATVAVAASSSSSHMHKFHRGRPTGGAMNFGLHNHVGPDVVQGILQRHALQDTVWFSQLIDHFDPQDDRTFKQQYMVNTTYAKEKNPPVFLMLGGEGPASPVWLEAPTAIMGYAKEVGAVVIQLEHRFYGISQPFDDLSTEHLKYLSSQQALADAAKFIQSFYELRGYSFDKNKLVVFGGSYSGALAGFFRTKYPHLAAGAVATSSPVEAKLDFVEYHEVVSASLSTTKHGVECISNLKSATEKLQAMVADASSRSKVASMFNVCPSSDLSSVDDQQTFYINLVSLIDGVVQYNRDNFAFEGHARKQPTIDDICANMTKDGDALTNYANVSFYLSDGECLESSYLVTIRQLRNESLDSSVAEGARQWTYQTCVEFAYFQSSDAKDQPFGTGFPLSSFVKQCQDIFDVQDPSIFVNWTNDYYGGFDISGTNIVFPNGQIDPWHKLSVTSSDSSLNQTGILMKSTAHCANMYPPSKSDPEELTQTRETILSLIKKWVN